MKTGIVKWFNDAKGYGFISRGDGGKDLYVYYYDIDDDKKYFSEGQIVTYEIENETSLYAKHVRRAK